MRMDVIWAKNKTGLEQLSRKEGSWAFSLHLAAKVLKFCVQRPKSENVKLFPRPFSNAFPFFCSFFLGFESERTCMISCPSWKVTRRNSIREGEGRLHNVNHERRFLRTKPLLQARDIMALRHSFAAAIAKPCDCAHDSAYSSSGTFTSAEHCQQQWGEAEWADQAARGRGGLSETLLLQMSL